MLTVISNTTFCTESPGLPRITGMLLALPPVVVILSCLESDRMPWLTRGYAKTPSTLPSSVSGAESLNVYSRRRSPELLPSSATTLPTEFFPSRDYNRNRHGLWSRIRLLFRRIHRIRNEIGCKRRESVFPISTARLS